MTKTQAIEANPAGYTYNEIVCAAETLRGMANHLWDVANADTKHLGKAFAADRMAERAEKLEAIL